MNTALVQELVCVDTHTHTHINTQRHIHIRKHKHTHPQDYYNSMNTVLVQELVRFNALAAAMRASLASLAHAVEGLALMSAELDELGRSLFDGKV